MIIMGILIVSLTVKSLLKKEIWDMVTQWLKQIQADIFCLQKCGLPSSRNVSLFERCWLYGPAMWNGSNGNRAIGIAILLKGDMVHYLQHKGIIAGRLFITLRTE